MKISLLFVVLLQCFACNTYKDVRELRLVAFEDNVKKGKGQGEVEGSDCVYHVFGYWLGGMPTTSRAIKNARFQRTSTVADAGGGSTSGKDGVRYINNLSVKAEGFDAVVFGKRCLTASGLGYK